MTALPIARMPVLSWFKRPARSAAPLPEATGDDWRREYMSRLIADEGCVGEYGVQALMGVFPKDF